jgi:hypothetical protein
MDLLKAADKILFIGASPAKLCTQFKAAANARWLLLWKALVRRWLRPAV